MKRFPLAAILAAGLVPGLAHAQTMVVRYEVVDLGPAPAASEVCPCYFTNAINASGDAAGFFFGTDGTYNAFAYRGGTMEDISAPGDNLAFGRGINDLGWAVGWTNAFGIQHAFVHDGDTLIDLGTMGGTYSDAHDVNNAGLVVGMSSTPFPEDDTHAAVWQDSVWTDLGTLGGPFSEALAVNEDGFIVGWAWNDAWDRRAVYWNADLSGPFELPSFSLPERHTIANGVNDAGVIVGQIEMEPFEAGPSWRAVRWEDGVVTDLGLLPEAGEGSNPYLLTPHTSTVAIDVNAAGVIIGRSFPESTEPDRPGPFVHRGGVMTNLNDLLDTTGWIVTALSSINDAGMIGASARPADDNHSRAVILMPVARPLGDIDGSGVVDFGDLVLLLSSWGPCAGCAADLDGDGVVAFADVLALLANWGAGG